MIIAIANSKGGCGKSSTVLMLTGAALQLNPDINITLIDTDVQNSIGTFMRRREKFGRDNYNVRSFSFPAGSSVENVHRVVRLQTH